MEPIELLRAIRRQLDESDAWMQLAAAQRVAHCWEGSEETALSNLSHQLSGDGRRHFPLVDAPLVIEATGLDYVTPLLQVVHLESRLKLEQRKPARRGRTQRRA